MPANDNVKALQTDLNTKINKLGLKIPLLKVDGIIGPLTSAAKSAVENYNPFKLDKGMFSTSKESTRVAPSNVKKSDEDFAAEDNDFRSMVPLPLNATSFLKKTITGKNSLNKKSVSPEERSILYKAAENAIKRTGSLKGGIEYKDYKGTMPKEDYNQLLKLVNGKGNVITGTILGATSPGYDVATTLGRFSYEKNPKTGQIDLNDSYDFINNYTQDKKTGKLKKDYMKDESSIYAMLRRSAAKKDQSLTAEDLQKNKVKMGLSPRDTIGYAPRTQSSLVGKVLSTLDNFLDKKK